MSRLLPLFLTFCWFLFPHIGTAQTVPFQNAVGSQAGEEFWDGFYDNSTQLFVAVGSGNIGAATADIWVSQYQPTGALVMSKRLQFPAGTPQGYFAARDICEAPPHPNLGPTYYITGIFKGQTVAAGVSAQPQQFVARITTSGAVVWFNLAYLQPNVAQSEGIAVVAMTNGDVVAIGNAKDYQGFANVVGSRFAPGGTLLWTNYYARRSGAFVAREACRNEHGQSCSAGADAGVIVVGEVRGETSLPQMYGSSDRSFAMQIDGAGNECWRYAYPSAPFNNPNGQGIQADAAYDIVPNNDNNGGQAGSYTVVGRADFTNPTGGNTPLGRGIYTFQIQPNGNWLCGSIYSDAAAGGNAASDIFARGVTASAQTGKVVVTGPRFGTSDVFIAELSTACAQQPPLWAKHYANWGSDALNTTLPGIVQGGVPESVHFVNSQNPGYFVTANTHPGMFGLRDGHLISTDLMGNVPNACPGVNINLVPSFAGEIFQLPGAKEQLLSWNTKQVSTFSYAVSDSLCANNAPSPCVVNADFTYTIDYCRSLLTATSTSSGNGSLSYLWTGGIVAPTFTTYVLPGVNTICLSVTNTTADGFTCQDDTCITIQMPANGSLAVAISGQSTCGQSFLTANATGGAAPYSFQWSNGATTATNVVNASGVYCVTVTDANNCTASSCFTVSLTAPYPVSINFTPGCGVFVLSALVPIGAAGSFVWSNGATTPSITVSSSGIYCVSFSDPAGCSSSACATVAVPPAMSVAFTSALASPTNCLRLNFTSAISGGAAPYTYTWSFAGANPSTSTAANPSGVSYPTAGLYTVCVTVTAANGCTATACQQVQVGQTCNLNNVDFCTTVEPFGTTGFRVTVSGVTQNCNGTATVQYSFNGGTTWGTSPSFTTSTPGTIIVCVRVTCVVCGQTCTRTCCKNVQINAPCNIPATATLNVSVNHTTRVATFTASTLSPAAMDYLWDFNGDGSIDATTTTNVTTNTYTYGTHQACVTIRRSATCTKRICRTVIVEEPCNVTANFSARHCTNSPLTVNFTSLATNNTSVQWFFGDGNISFANNPTHTYAAAGTYTVELNAYKPNSNCMMRATYTVIVAPKNCGGNNVPPTNLTVNDNGEETAEEVDNILLETDGTDQSTSVPVIDGLSLFPNPANEQTHLIFELDRAQEVQVTVIDMNGKIYENLQSSSTIGRNAITIPTDRLGQGLYLVRLNAGGTVRTAKLLIQR